MVSNVSYWAGTIVRNGLLICGTELPKEHSIFRIKVPIDSTTEKDDEKELVFEIHGEQFQNRAPDRSK